jgi:hypothetical protein
VIVCVICSFHELAKGRVEDCLTMAQVCSAAGWV